jgi:DNA-binding LytR/AlgR family response regulator
MEPAKILIVEDEFIIAEKLSADLSDIGYDITEVVSSGENAIRSVTENPPDLIIMDINIDGELDGIQTAKKILSLMAIPVIYLTGLTDQSVFQKARLTRPAGYLSKPYNQQDVYHAIELALYNASSDLHPATDKKQQDSAYILNDRIFLKDNKNCFNKISVDDIFWIKADGSYSHIETKQGKFLTTNNIKTIEKKIFNPQFVRIHRSYLININWIKQIVGKSYVILEFPAPDGTKATNTKVEIPIGAEYRENISQIIRII